MESTSKKTDDRNSTSDDSDKETEVFAASAAEGAISSGRKDLGEESTDLEALTQAIEQSSVSPVEPEKPETPDEPERTLTKEEMVEEALNCPCISAMKDGPCGDSFISAYRCFLESETEPKGMDCMDQFTGMQGCMAEHPDEYNLDDDDEDPFALDKQEPETPEPPSDVTPAPSSTSASEPASASA